VLATPASPGSITTSGNKEDFVSMGMTSALKLRQGLELAANVMAIEFVCAEFAMESLRPLKTGKSLEPVREELRKIIEPRFEDRSNATVISAVREWLRAWRRPGSPSSS
jgi:histidine ammonia-lyase